ncbi:MAG: LamG domain-containing protein, partial [Planctomycetota bacterium]
PTADTYYFGCVTIFDSDEREGSALIYDSTDRLALGDQFKDLEIDLTEGGSRVFDDASSQYLRVDSVVFDESDAVTFGCWFKTDDLTADQALIGIGDKDNPFERLWIQVEGATAGDPIGVSMDGAGGADTTTGISSNTWHHACATSDGAASPALQILLDGGSKGTTSGTAHTVSGIDGLDIGRLRDSTSPFNYMSGKIAHAFVYNVVLTDAEVARLAAGALPTEIRPEALVAYWPLTDNDGDPIGGYAMTPYNSPTWSTTDYPDVFKPTKGRHVIDNILPAPIGESGFGADGAFHLDQTEVKDKPIIQTIDRTRIRTTHVIHDRRFIYGSVQNPTII